MYYKKNMFKYRSILQEAGFFIRDLIATLLYFALHPFQYLFLHFPRFYDNLMLIFSAIRNVLPTKDEIFHTGLHWYYNILKFILTFNRISIKILIKFSQSLHSKAESIISKYPSYIK